MEYTIHGFSQENAIKLGLDDRDLLILRWFIRFKDTGKMATKIIKDDKFYWINYSAIVDSLPIMKIKNNDSVYRRLKKMAKVGILKHETVKGGGVYSYFALGENYPALVDTSREITDLKSEGSDLKPRCSDLKSEGSDLKPRCSDLKSEQKTLIPYPNTITLIPQPYEVVVEKIKEYFLLDEKDIKKIASAHLATKKDISYLVEKLELTKNNVNVKDVVAYLLTAIKNNYTVSIAQTNNFIPSKPLNTRLHNVNPTFKKYSDKELERMLFESQKGKFNLEQ